MAVAGPAAGGGGGSGVVALLSLLWQQLWQAVVHIWQLLTGGVAGGGGRNPAPTAAPSPTAGAPAAAPPTAASRSSRKPASGRIATLRDLQADADADEPAAGGRGPASFYNGNSTQFSGRPGPSSAAPPEDAEDVF